MANIPLQIASRSLDTGPTVQYPQGGEVGRAIQGFGAELGAVADHLKQVDDRQARFDTGVVDDELRQRLAQTEADAARNAPADGSGIHDSVYGQIDPKTGQAVKPGAFDQLFDEYAQKVPESQRANFMASKEGLRLAGSNRLATVQYASRQAYEQVQITKSQDTLLTGILTSDPNDVKTFEAFKQNGLDRIANSGMDALDKEKAAYNWDQNATQALFKSMLEKDPTFAGRARGALGFAPVQQGGAGAVGTVVDKIIGVESGGDPNAKNPNSSASGVGQFLDSTWVQTIRQHRPDLAVGKSAAQIIALKGDQVLGKEMTTAFTQDNADYLTNRGLATTPGNLYLAHFLGAGGAVNVLKANPSASIASVVGQDVVNANPFLAGKTVADTVAWSNKKMGGTSSAPDPRWAGLSPEARLTLANQADVQYRQQQSTQQATEKADYTAYKDRFELGIVQGQIADSGIIVNDKRLNDGDKASLLRSWNEQSKGALQIQSDLTALNNGTLGLDPYSSTDKTRADNLYADAMKRVPQDQQAALASSIIQQTGVVPQPVLNAIRQGLASQTPAQVIAAAQTAQRISAYDPAALGRRDGGSEVQKAADDFSFYANKLNLTPDQAAQRMIDNASPEKQRDRKVLEPAAKEFVKSISGEDLAGDFKDHWYSGTPTLGLTAAQELGIKAEFVAIAEDQFYAKNGDPDLAKNAAIQQMKALYGVSTVAGDNVLMKHPPEQYWPKQTNTGMTMSVLGLRLGTVMEDPFAYAKQQLHAELDEMSGRGSAGPLTVFAGRVEGGNIDLANRPQVKNQDGSISTVRSMSFEEDGKEILVPTVSPDGKIMSDQQAIDLYHQSGQHLGKFDNAADANAYADALHKTQARYYGSADVIDMSTVRLVSTPETDADVKAGRMPGYAVLYTDKNGNLQTIPGKVFRPDASNTVAGEQDRAAKAQAEATAAASAKDLRILSGQDREFTQQNMESGNTLVYTPERRAQFLKDEAARQKAVPDIPTPGDAADPYALGSPL